MPATNSQKSVPWNIFSIKSPFSALLKICTMKICTIICTIVYVFFENLCPSTFALSRHRKLTFDNFCFLGLFSFISATTCRLWCTTARCRQVRLLKSSLFPLCWRGQQRAALRRRMNTHSEKKNTLYRRFA